MSRRLLPTPAMAARAGALRAAAWLMVLVLIGAQSIGLWHRLAHDHHPALAGAEPATAASPFGHAEHDLAACQAFDHLALADVLSVVATNLAVVAPVVPGADDLVEGMAQARPGHYRARGPPAA